MFTFFLFALLVGGGLLVWSLFGGDGHDADVAHGHPDGHDAAQWLSLRTIVYFLFVFGGVGAILSKTWPTALVPVVFLLAAGAGVAVAALVAVAFRYLRATESGNRQTDDSFVGLMGRVTLPIAANRAGKVLVTRGERTFELLARPLESSGSPAAWTSVVIVEMDRGTAVVVPSDHPSARELSLLNP